MRFPRLFGCALLLAHACTPDASGLTHGDAAAPAPLADLPSSTDASQPDAATLEPGPTQPDAAFGQERAVDADVSMPPSADAASCATDGTCGEAGGDAGDSNGAHDAGTLTLASYRVRGLVAGLRGTGLSLALNGQSPLAVGAAGAFEFPAALPDGAAFEVTVASQPSGPSAVCHVMGGSGYITGHDADQVQVSCDELGGLRISEVGSCFHFDSACWLELYNAGSETEQLSDYQIKTPAAGGQFPYTRAAEHLFPLPALQVLPGRYAVVAAASSWALADGQGVVHVQDAGLLPWWSSSGFVELLSAGRSVDFVRFGTNIVQPTTPGSFGEQAAPALPTGSGSYGKALARDRQLSDSNRAEDFRVRSFSTPRGDNDVSSDTDDDADGLPDSAEVSGGRFAGLDLYAMGARVGVRDVFVEVDRMSSLDPALTPLREALAKLVSVFAAQGIAVHLDVGDLFAPSFDPTQYNLGGGNPVPFAKGVGFRPDDAGIADLYDYKAQHMAGERRSVFYYMLFGYSQEQSGAPGSAGIGERPGNDSIITLGGYNFSTNTQRQRNLLANYQASSMMHELGHNLGLSHGGDEDRNDKPNYVSVMNYLYGSLGLPAIGTDSEGDRYDLSTSCSIWFITQLERGPTVAPELFNMDFSHGTHADLDETQVRESEGLGALESAPVDYDCSGRIEDGYAADLNADGKLSTLHDYDDWANLQLVFRRWVSSNDNGPLLATQAVEPVAAFVNDHQPLPSEACPAPALRPQ